MMLTALSSMTSKHEDPTGSTMKRTNFLDYAASQEKAFITYHASDMVLMDQSDALYLSENTTRLRAGGDWYLSKDKEAPLIIEHCKPLLYHQIYHGLLSGG